MLEEFPWLTDADFAVIGGSQHRHNRHDTRAAARPKHVLDAEKAEVDAIACKARLMALRKEWFEDWAGKWFYTRHLGGPWTEEHIGRESDICSMFAREKVKGWCKAYKWPAQKGFAYKAYNGVEPCTMLAREWALRGHFFYDMWKRAGESMAFSYTQAQLDSYVATDEWIYWQADVPIDDKAFDKVLQVNSAVPTNPT